MTTGLARASVRARPSAFAGTFAALVFSATVVTACVAIAVSAAGPPISSRQSEISEMGVAFTLLTVYMSVFVIGQVMSLAVAQRRRESALLRAVGAGPWQIRRMVMAEALCTALLALPVGYGLGVLLARVWFDGMAGHGMIPDGLSLSVGWPSLLAAAGVLVASSQLGGLIAAWRASRTRPSAALADAAVPGGERAGRVRGLLSVVFLFGAGALTVAAGTGSAADAASEIPLVLLAYLIVIGLAGPWIGRLAIAAAAPSLRRFAGLVAANTLVMLTLERLREFSLLRTVGAEDRQVVAVLLWEGAITALAGLGAGVLAGCAVMIPLGGKTGTPLTGLSADTWAAILVSGLVLVLTSSCAPLARILRVRPRGFSGVRGMAGAASRRYAPRNGPGTRRRWR
jgi:putative ABC transport system permease protein